MSNLIDMMEQVKKLKNGMGVKKLLFSAAEILGNPIAMFNTEYTLQCYTQKETDDPIWQELISLGTFGEITVRFFEKAGFIEETANKRIAYLTADCLKYDRINGKLFNKNNTHVSNLIIVACNKPFEEHDIKVFDFICKLISKEISDDEEIARYEQQHQQWLLNYLIDGNYEIKMNLSQVEILYGTLDPNLYLVVADISFSSIENATPAHFIDLFKKVKPAYKYADYSGYIIIIISTSDETLNVKSELKELIDLFEKNNIYAGLSGRFENLFDLKKHYLNALKSLEYVLKCRCSQIIFPYNTDSLDTMKQIETLENGLGVQYFLDMVPNIFGNPALFHDMELNLLAYSKNMEIKDPIWQELITYGTSSNETIELFRTEGLIDLMDNVKGGAFLISEKLKYSHLTWKIYNNEEIRIGCTSISCTHKSFSEDELVLFGTFNQKFSKEVSKIEFYNNYGQVYSETIINRLISGKIDSYTFYSENIGNLYDHLMDNFYLIVADTTQCISEHGSLTYIRNLFNLPNTVSRYALYSTYIVIIISTDDTLFNKNSKLNGIIEIFEKNNIYVGISSRFGNLYELPKRYKEAVNALKTIREKSVSKVSR